MEHLNTIGYLMELIDRPAFCVHDGIITEVNQAASRRQVIIGTPITELLLPNSQVYEDFNDGALQLTLSIAGIIHQASVERMDTCDIFLLESDSARPELQSLALAAQHLRSPLSGVMAMVELLQGNPALREDSTVLSQITQVNRGLYQLQRMVCSMSDTGQYMFPENARMETVDIGNIFYETLEKANTLLSGNDVHVNFTGLNSPVFCAADAQMLERATYNLISNAVKFSNKPCTVEAKLTRNGNMLYFSVQDNGDFIPDAVQKNVFSRFLREPGIEDGTFGIGLGLTLVRAVAAAHGGTVLIDKQKNKGKRITMTIAISEDNTGNLRSPILQLGDYAGGRDHGLLELADVLPSTLFDTAKY